MRPQSRWALPLLFLAAAGCAGRPADVAKDTLSTRQRQERIGGMPIPGARGVGRALQVQDSARSHAKAVDSIAAER